MPAIKRRPHPWEERPGAGAKQFALKTKGNPIGVAEYQLQPKLPADIKGPLRDALTADGWRVGFFTGDDKSGLDGFLRGDVDVLIGSSAIGTGVDGLQDVCERLIVNVLP
jgi:hypothetical protein